MAGKATNIPTATILRLSIYHRYLQSLMERGTKVVSSAQLANGTNVNAAQLRKDLSYFGRFGVRGVGYNVSKLLRQIKEILGLGKSWNMALIGAGNIGKALLQHKQFENHGYNFVLVFDKTPFRVGKEILPGIEVHHIDKIKELAATTPIDLAVIAVPASQAQEMADTIIEAGISGILNFAPVRLKVPNHVALQHVDFTTLLDTLTYALSTKEKKGAYYNKKKEEENRNARWDSLQSWPDHMINYSNLLVTK